MWASLVSATVPMSAVDAAIEIPSPDINALLPLAILCMSSILCTIVWFLAVSSYTTERHDSMA